jgi:hypothetical protein
LRHHRSCDQTGKRSDLQLKLSESFVKTGFRTKKINNIE